MKIPFRNPHAGLAIAPSDSLADILAVERELGGKLDDEKARAAQWLDETNRAPAEAAQSELAVLKDRLRRRTRRAAKKSVAERELPTSSSRRKLSAAASMVLMTRI